MNDRNFAPPNVLFMGNDINDLPVIPYVNIVAAPSDAHVDFLQRATYVTKSKGGHGAVRELCDFISNIKITGEI